MDRDDLIRGQEAYRKVCEYLDNRGWKYERIDERLSIQTGSVGEDLPMPLRISIYPSSQRMMMISVFPFDAAEDKRVEMAVAIAAINNTLITGAFDYNIKNGLIAFKISTSYIGCELNEELFQFLLEASMAIVDHYNDKLYAINEGKLDIQQFLAEVISDEE